MFVALGLRNAWRNRARTVLGILSMAVAAVIFTSGSLSKGYPAGAFWEARQLIGGEILLLPERICLSKDSLAGNYTWRFERRSYDRPGLLMGFDPVPYWYGGMTSDQVSRNRIGQVLNELREDRSVAAANIRKSIPFLMDSNSGYVYGFIEPRDMSTDTEIYKIAVDLRPDDSMTGVLCGKTLPGSKVRIEIPSFRSDGLVFDYENPVVISLDIVGQASFGGSNPGVPVVFVTPETFEKVRQAAGIPEPRTVWGISISVKNMSELENYVGLLRRRYSEFTVYPVSAAGTQESLAAGVPLDMRRVTEALSFMIAALMSATNLSVLMLARKNEIGILRALGATRGNIAAMVLSESVWIALIGSFMGGLLTQPAILWQLLSNKIGSGTVAATICANMGKSLGFSVTAALVFGFLPVAKALRVTPAQVFRE